MSSEIEEKSSFRLPESLVPAQIIQKTQKYVSSRAYSNKFSLCNIFELCIRQPELLYSRDFLLSLRDLDICTELPSGFDESVLWYIHFLTI